MKKSNKHLLIIYVEIGWSQNLALVWSQIAVLILMTGLANIFNDFTNRRFMISIWIYIDYLPFMIAKSYRAFEAFSGHVASIL